jgi:hypothetical protein
VFGIADDVWNNLEANYRAFHARKRADQELEKQVAWVKRFPVKQLVERKLLEVPQSPVHAVGLLLRFFVVASIAVWEERYSSLPIAYRRSPAFLSELEPLAAWLRTGELLAQKIATDPYDRDTFMHALRELRSLTNERIEDFEPKMKELCRRSGVAVVFVSEFPKTHLSGAARWLTPEKALAQLSLRHKTNDHFWFSLFHEAAHILNHSKKGLYIDEENHLISDEEKQADDFASRMLIPLKEYRAFVAASRFTRRSILKFADRVGIAPGIVVGRLQHDNHITFSRLNDLKVRFRLIGEVD